MSSSTTQFLGSIPSDPFRQSEIEGKFRIFTGTVELQTDRRVQLLNVTDYITDVVKRSHIQEGQVHVQTLHTTTSLFINEWQDALVKDILQAIERIVPRENYWRHNDAAYSDCDRQNADSHLRALLLGPSLNLQVRSAAILLGVWQRIILAEFDGPRPRAFSIQVTGI
jgi:secondary thiamine-phosphate synthase enzyme